MLSTTIRGRSAPHGRATNVQFVKPRWCLDSTATVVRPAVAACTVAANRHSTPFFASRHRSGSRRAVLHRWDRPLYLEYRAVSSFQNESGSGEANCDLGAAWPLQAEQKPDVSGVAVSVSCGSILVEQCLGAGVGSAGDRDRPTRGDRKRGAL